MSFGTSSTARLVNTLPLNQRFTDKAARAVRDVGMSSETNQWLLDRLEAWTKRNGTSNGMPGWDADGREAT